MEFGNNLQNNQEIPGGMHTSIPVMPEQENRLSSAAMITGIIGAGSVFFLPFYLPCIFAGISMLLALLSRGSAKRLSRHAKTGLIVSLCSLALNLLILFGCYYLVFHVPEFRQEFDRVYEQMYGESFADTLEQILGE